jgi:cell division protein FtsX
MKSKYFPDVIYGLVGLISAGIAIWQLYLFATFRAVSGSVDARADTFHLWLAIGAAVVTGICLLLFFLRHVNKEEEFHITS